MNHPDNIMLYVENPAQSAAFYGKLFGLSPVELSPVFALFVLQSGLKLAFWAKHNVVPNPEGSGCSFELSVKMADRAAVDDLYRTWRELAAEVVMEPAQLPFGWSFVITDPDGYRLRVYALESDM